MAYAPDLSATLLYDGGLATLAAFMIGMLVHPRMRGANPSPDDLFRGVPLNGRTVYCLTDATGTVRCISPNAEIVLGAACARAAQAGLHAAELLQPDDATQLTEWLDLAGRQSITAEADATTSHGSGGTAPIVLATRAPDASTRWLELNASGRMTLGSKECLLIEVRDVTWKAVHERTRDTLAAAFVGAADAVYVTGPDGLIQYANGAFERLTGYSIESALGMPASRLTAADQTPELFSRMWASLRAGRPFTGEVINRRADGTRYTVDLVITPIGVPSDPRYLAVARDITERKRNERDAEDLAYRDPLTDLPSQRLLRERSTQILALARRHGSMAALIHIDIDRMSGVNAQYGRAAGDEVLRTMAERLRQGLRESDTLARLGSDEFLVLLSEAQDEQAIARIVRRLHDLITQPFRLAQSTITVAAHAGLALYPDDGETFDDLLSGAGTAMNRARKAGTGFEFLDGALSVSTSDSLSLEDDLNWAWEHDQFVLHYQPIIGVDGRIIGAEALARGRVIGMEALARWPHLERGMLSPAQFIPLAERTGRIRALDRWAIATASRQAAAWVATGWDGWVSVNLSARTLHDADLPAYVDRTLKTHGLPARHLVVEITEGSAMKDPLVTARVLGELRTMGVLIAVDDFGVGHSSLAYLKLFPVDLLKLDASFVRDIGTGGREEHLVEMMISLAHRIGAKVVGEGVEHGAQMNWLRGAGCDYVQGYLLGRPAAAEAWPPADPEPRHQLPPGAAAD